MKIGIIGAGAFGLALRNVFEKNNEVEIYGREAAQIPREKAPELLFLAIPSDAQICDENAVRFYINRFRDSTIILTSKGLESLHLYRSLSSEQKKRVLILSGPNLSDQLGRTPSAAILAGFDKEYTKEIAKFLTNENFRVYASTSPSVVQLGGIYKNLFVFYLGKNWSRISTIPEKIAVIMEVIMTEKALIKKNMNQNENLAEFYGASGIGDLLLCLDIFPIKKGGIQSRNFLAGQALAQGMSDSDLYAKFKTIESYELVKKIEKNIPDDLDCVQFCDFLQNLENSDFGYSYSIEKETATYQEMSAEWADFLQEAKEKEYLSNTFAWKFCRILIKSIKKFSRDLTDEKVIKESVEQLLFVVLREKVAE